MLKTALVKYPAIARVVREPLVHFLLAGLLLFAFFSFRGEPIDPQSRTIVVTAKKVEQLSTRWQQMWQRQPSQAELDGLINDYVREEIYTREALRMGMDRDDEVIRRRLRSKMEELARSEAENAVASDTGLQNWLDKYPERFVENAKFGFDQIYLGSGKEPLADADITAMQAQLSTKNNNAEWQKMGKPIALPFSVDDASRAEVSRSFGDDFVASLAKQPIGKWSGPILSGYGKHLVRLRNLQKPEQSKLAEVRQQVENDWRSSTSTILAENAYLALLSGYTLKIGKQ